MMDKNREAFEAWWEDQCEELPPKMMAFAAWQASRQAIEVELPTEMTRDNDYASGFNQCLSECNDALTSLGIRVKGNEE